MIYDLLAPFYDAINAEIDYEKWADFIEKIFEKECKNPPELVLDLGCGTGKMTLELASRGYDMTGIDYSPEMLDVARTAAEENGNDILWLCQDMREFELYGTVDATVCCLDCINHLESVEDLESCFKLVHNYLIPDCIFIFDINARYKFENIYSNNTYTMEEDGAVCIWENDYDPDSQICDFYITLFKECADGRYKRYDEQQSERMYPLAEIKSSLERCKMEFLYAFGDLDFTPGSDECERIYIVAKCRK
ncbi:MAG: class I SAM-dependent methyltransferase [Clostridia bacterium]|nr:class I SAM-dependent methyltransferase [Clostridia bacterium]